MDGHLPPDRLAADPPTPDEQAHLDRCARCRVARASFLAAASDATEDEPLDPAVLAPGTKVDRYEIVGVLGRGGMAVVYRARHLRLGTDHAIKLLHVSSEEIRHRLRTEGRVQARFRHPNIVQVTDVIDVQGAQGLLLEYVDGPNLATLLRSRGRPSPAQLDHLAAGVFAGVAAAHRAGLVHRDLKPENILVAQDEQGDLVPKIADFGLVKVVRGDADTDVGRTRTDAVMGTVRYMAPEQLQSSKSVDRRADVFALGAILYELVTGAHAFEGTDMVAIVNAISQGRFRPVRELAPEAEARWVAAIEAALAVDPAERPSDVEGLATLWRGGGDAAPVAPRGPLWPRDALDGLRPVLASVPAVVEEGSEISANRPASSPPAPSIVTRGPRSRGVPVALGMAGIALGVIGVGVAVWPGRDCPPLEGAYMPLAVGNWWRYRMIDPETGRDQGDKTLRIDGHGPVPGLDGLEAWRIDRTDGKGKSHRWLARIDDVTAWVFDDWADHDGVRTRSVTYRPPRIRVSERCEHRTAGASWTEVFDEVTVDPKTGTGSTATHHVKWEVVATDEEVTVPAGTFRTLRIRRVDPVSHEDQTYWFAPGVGKVKEFSPPKEDEALLEYHLEPAGTR